MTPPKRKQYYPLNDAPETLPCGHSAENLLTIDGVVIGCQECRNQITYDLIVALDKESFLSTKNSDGSDVGDWFEQIEGHTQ